MTGATARRPDGQLSWLGRHLVASAATPQRRSAAGIGAVLLLGAIAFGIDWATGPAFSALIVYVAATTVAAWFLGPIVGSYMAVTCAVFGSTVALFHDAADASTQSVIVNGILRGVVLVALVQGSCFLRRTLNQLDQASRFDPMTGLLNRRALFDRGQIERARAQRHGSTIAVAYIDLNGLKRVNDRDGHEAGDRFICQFATALRSGMREVDLVARLGGDEFVVLMPGAAEPQALTALRRVLSTPGLPTASVGIVVWHTDPPDVQTMITAADGLMYDAKARGAGMLATSHQVQSPADPGADGTALRS